MFGAGGGDFWVDTFQAFLPKNSFKITAAKLLYELYFISQQENPPP